MGRPRIGANQPTSTGEGKFNTTINFGEANPKQALFYSSRTLYTAYGGARGGGKTHAIRIKAAGGALRWPGIRILILRRTYPELQQNHIDPMKKMVPDTVAQYKESLHTMYFLNGSTIRFGHFSIGAAEEYQGQEYDWIFLDEATQFTYQEFRILGGCLRGTTSAPKRFYLTCNPGGVGHQWVKRLFIDRQFKTDSENAEENENPKDYSFIQATVEDNVHLIKASPAYVQMLSSLPENMRKAHRYGDWNALSGSYFPEFSTAKHVVKPFKIPDHWVRYRSLDYGLDMLACYWITVDQNGRCYVYRELKMPNLIPTEAAKLIQDCTLQNERIVCTFVPPDMWNRQKETGKTIAEQFMICGMGIVRADNNRVQGHIQIKEMLKDKQDGSPELLFFDSCKEIISDIQAIQADEKNPNDCAKEPHEITHTVDGVRYFCISRTLPTLTPEPSDDWDEPGIDEDYDDCMTGGEASANYLAY